MSTLTISTLDAIGAAAKVSFEIRLVDNNHDDVENAFVTASGAPVVKHYTATTSAAGTASVDVTPNASITPPNTYYLVTLGKRRFLIEKGSGTETMLAALKDDPVALEPTISSTKVSKAGDSMTGALAMGGNKVTGMADGDSTNDGANYGQLSTVAAFAAAALATETSTRASADATLTTNLATEVTDRTTGDATNATAITAEATSRGTADTAIKNGYYGIEAFYSLASLLRRNNRDVHVMLFSDSTADGSGTTLWPGQLMALIGAAFPAYTVKMHRANGGSNSDDYSSVNTISTGSGSNTLHLWNTAIAGTRFSTLFGYNRWTNLVAGIGTVASGAVAGASVDLCIFAHAHNEGDITTLTMTGNTAGSATTQQSAEQFVCRQVALIDEVRKVWPLAQGLVICSNPELSTTADDQDNRAHLLGRVAAMRGLSFIDTTPDFYADPGWATTTPSNTLMTDSLHPNAAGTTLYANIVYQYFRASMASRSMGVAPSGLHHPSPAQILRNPSLRHAQPGTIPEWAGSNATITRDTGTTRRGRAYSTKVVSTSGSGMLRQTLPAAAFAPYLGQWLTLSAWVYVPATEGTTTPQDMATTGVLRAYPTSLYTTFTHKRTSWEPFNGWQLMVLPFYVPPTTATIQIDIMASNGGNTGSVIYVDEVSLVAGMEAAELPRQGLREVSVQIAVTDPGGSAMTTGDGKAYYTVPEMYDGATVINVGGSLATASSSGVPQIQVRKVGVGDLLSTYLTIDANETDSTTAATPPVINATYKVLTAGEQLAIDIDTAGTGAKGLNVRLALVVPS